MKLGDDYRERLGLVEGEDVISLACGCDDGCGLYIIGPIAKIQEAARRHYDDTHGESMEQRILRGVARMLAYENVHAPESEEGLREYGDRLYRIGSREL